MCQNINKNNWYYPVGVLFFILLLSSMGIWSSLKWNNIILSLTAMIILWYTLETKRLSDLSKKQIEINIRPILIARWDGRTLRIKNIGRSPALNIWLEDIYHKNSRLEFHKIPLCEVEKEPGVGYKLFEGTTRVIASAEVNQKMTIFLPHNLKGNESYIIFIHYQDVEGDSWQSKCKVAKEGLLFEEVIKK